MSILRTFCSVLALSISILPSMAIARFELDTESTALPGAEAAHRRSRAQPGAGRRIQ